jgi:hypothetical protein
MLSLSHTLDRLPGTAKASDMYEKTGRAPIIIEVVALIVTRCFAEHDLLL